MVVIILSKELRTVIIILMAFYNLWIRVVFLRLSFKIYQGASIKNILKGNYNPLNSLLICY